MFAGQGVSAGGGQEEGAGGQGGRDWEEGSEGPFCCPCSGKEKGGGYTLGLSLKFGGLSKLLFQNSITYFLVNQSLI